MPADGRYISLGKCRGTMRMGSFARVTFLLALRGTTPLTVVLATRFTSGLLHHDYHESASQRWQAALGEQCRDCRQQQHEKCATHRQDELSISRREPARVDTGCQRP